MVLQEMANLRGKSLSSQAVDGFHRLEKFGVKRHGTKDNFTHSMGLAQKREGYLRDIKNFSIENKLTGKLNKIMSNKTVMDKFFEKRMKTLNPSSQENYLRGYSSMLEGLKQANISIGIDKSYFNEKVSKIEKETTFKTGRAITNPDKLIEKIYQSRYGSGVIAEVQKELAFRTSEAIELVKNHDKYISENTVSRIVGKGNHIYIDKYISNDLKMKIEAVEKVPHEDTYRVDFKEASNSEHIPHDFRFTYAKSEMENKLSQGIGYSQAMKEVSLALNHVSAERTKYYLARA